MVKIKILVFWALNRRISGHVVVWVVGLLEVVVAYLLDHSNVDRGSSARAVYLRRARHYSDLKSDEDPSLAGGI